MPSLAALLLLATATLPLAAVDWVDFQTGQDLAPLRLGAVTIGHDPGYRGDFADDGILVSEGRGVASLYSSYGYGKLARRRLHPAGARQRARHRGALGAPGGARRGAGRSGCGAHFLVDLSD